MVVASFGGGVNSTAMLIGMVERGEKCDYILFADTGGEKPNTYRHVETFSSWLTDHGMPGIITLKAPNETLEESCLKLGVLPAVAYGFKTCSQRFKVEPQHKWLRNLPLPIGRIDSGNGEVGTITRLIGFDAGEAYRAKDIDGNRYPLIEWNWDREECIAAIDRARLPQPGKSSCFFCPNMKKREIFELRQKYPDLAARAVAMERNAELTNIKGLGRSFAWGDLYAADDAQTKLFPESTVRQCDVCYDGD